MASIRKRSPTIYEGIALNDASLSVPTYKRRRVTRQTYGTGADIPIVLDSSSSDASDTGSSSDQDSSSSSHILDLDTVLANSKQINKEKRDSLKKAVLSKSPKTPDSTKTKTIEKPSEVPKNNDDATPTNKNGSNAPTKKSAFAMISESRKSSNIVDVFTDLNTKDKVKPATTLKNQNEHTKEIKNNSVPKTPLSSAMRPTVKTPVPVSTSSDQSNLKSSKTENLDKPIKKVIINSLTKPSPLPIQAANSIARSLKIKKINPTTTQIPPKLQKPTVFDPKTQKSYKDTYSVCCISCKKKNRSEYCNRQKPCDICVGKKLKNCTYPESAKIAIPAELNKKSGSKNKSENSKQPVHNEESDLENRENFKIDTSYKRFNLTKSRRRNANKVVKDSDDESEEKENVDLNKKNSVSQTDESSRSSSSTSSSESITESKDFQKGSATVESNVKKATRKSPKKTKNSSFIVDDEDDDSDAEAENADYEGGDDDDDDEDSDINDSDDAFGEDEDKKEETDKYYRKSKSKADDFEKAKKLLKELEFEKRDVEAIYGDNTRKRRSATRENYFIPSDGDNDSNSDDGYAAAEARNEQVILSEDEQERRMLRGEIGLDYIESLRNERAKYSNQISSDSLSSDDEDF